MHRLCDKGRARRSRLIVIDDAARGVRRLSFVQIARIGTVRRKHEHARCGVRSGASAVSAGGSADAGLSFAVHIPLVCFGIAFPAMVLFMEWLGMRTGDPLYRTIARR
jgi:hypothetical protein